MAKGCRGMDACITELIARIGVLCRVMSWHCEVPPAQLEDKGRRALARCQKLREITAEAHPGWPSIKFRVRMSVTLKGNASKRAFTNL